MTRVVMGMALGHARQPRQHWAVPSSAWTPVSSTHGTIAASGGFRYSPTRSRTFQLTWASVASLKGRPGLVMAAASVVLALGFDLTAIASIGSAVALLVFMLVTAAHFRVRSQTSARLGLLVAAIATTAVALLTFVFTTLISEPASAITLAVILLVSIVLDHRWRRVRDHRRELASLNSG